MSKVRDSSGKRLKDLFLTTWPLFAAVGFTVVFGWWVYGLASEAVRTENGHWMSRWVQFRLSSPNSMGDTLAGFIGSLTLIWVVASVIQQSMELKAQRKEFVEMVRAQDAQVKALEAQAAIFEDERVYRAQAASSEEFKRLLEGISQRIKRSGEPENIASWLFDSGKYWNVANAGSPKRFSKFDNLETPDEVIYQASLKIMERHALREKKVADFLEDFYGEEILRKLDRRLDRVLEIEPQLPRSDTVRIHDLGLPVFSAVIKDVLAAIEVHKKALATQ